MMSTDIKELEVRSHFTEPSFKGNCEYRLKCQRIKSQPTVLKKRARCEARFTELGTVAP